MTGDCFCRVFCMCCCSAIGVWSAMDEAKQPGTVKRQPGWKCSVQKLDFKHGQEMYCVGDFPWLFIHIHYLAADIWRLLIKQQCITNILELGVWHQLTHERSIPPQLASHSWHAVSTVGHLSSPSIACCPKLLLFGWSQMWHLPSVIFSVKGIFKSSCWIWPSLFFLLLSSLAASEVIASSTVLHVEWQFS